MKHLAFTLAVCSLWLAVSAQSPAYREIVANRSLSGSNYLAYIAPDQPLTPSPKGYEPFYINHYGRHGSRWLIDDEDYTGVLDVLRTAARSGKLTAEGQDVLDRLERFYPTSHDRLGDLTTVGERQHHGIGRRMTEHFPEVFRGQAQVDARSTVVIRCILSMEAECEELTAFNPQLRIHNDVSESLQYYLNQNHSREISRATRAASARYMDGYRQQYTHPERLCRLLFNDQDYVYANVNAGSFMRRLFDVAANMQSHDTDIDFYSLFTDEECYDQWRLRNISWYLGYGPAPASQGLAPWSQENLLDNFLATADTLVTDRDFHGATLRFGHEVCVMPLACLLELGDCGWQTECLDSLDWHWANYRIFPMACNIQLVYYRPQARKGKPAPEGDILVKALLNEREVSLPVATDSYPYYKWDDVRRYYADKLEAYRRERQ